MPPQYVISDQFSRRSNLMYVVVRSSLYLSKDLDGRFDQSSDQTLSHGTLVLCILSACV